MKKILLSLVLFCTATQTHTMMNGLRRAAQVTTRVLHNPKITQQQIKRMDSSHSKSHASHDNNYSDRMNTIVNASISFTLSFFVFYEIFLLRDHTELNEEIKKYKQEKI